MTVTRAEYLTQRHPRYGITNPEKVDYAVWKRLISGDRSASKGFGHFSYEGHRRFMTIDYSSRYRESAQGPYWHWQNRFGRTSTPLPDGRVVHVGGNFEQDHDPDFCIYNDVVVDYPCGRLDIYLYPKDVFPPTDFHSATRIGPAIILIGSLGYIDLRRPETTQVLQLDTRSFRIERLVPNGRGPGWLCDHKAEYDTKLESIVVTGGRVIGPDNESSEHNGWEIQLSLDKLRWR